MDASILCAMWRTVIRPPAWLEEVPLSRAFPCPGKLLPLLNSTLQRLGWWISGDGKTLHRTDDQGRVRSIGVGLESFRCVLYGGLHTTIATCMSARRHACGTPCSVSTLHLPSASAFLLLHVMHSLSLVAIVLRLRLPLATVHSPLPLLGQGLANGISMQVGTLDLSMRDTGAAAVTLPRPDLILLGLVSPLPNAVWALNLRRIELPSGFWPDLCLNTRQHHSCHRPS